MTTPTPLPPRNRPSAKARENDTSSLSLPYSSKKFTINYGTVILDRRARKIMLVYGRPNGVYQLPKGPGTGNDGLLATAIQEARDDTGYHVTPLNIKWPQGQSSDQPVACIHSRNKFAHEMRITFYFGGEAISCNRQLWTPFPERKHETYWFGYEEGRKQLFYLEERFVIDKVLSLLQ